MRHRYPTTALVLGRTSLGEGSALITLLTADLGLIRARAQGLRRPGAKLAASLATFAESEVALVRGAEGWRVTGAALAQNWFFGLSRAARPRAARIVGLLLRLAPGEAVDPRLPVILREAFSAFVTEPAFLHEAIECRAVLQFLSVLGLDAGSIPALAAAERERPALIARINRGIAHSGL